MKDVQHPIHNVRNVNWNERLNVRRVNCLTNLSTVGCQNDIGTITPIQEDLSIVAGERTSQKMSDFKCSIECILESIFKMKINSFRLINEHKH